MSTMTLNGVRRKVTPIMLPVNVRSIRHRSVSVKKTIITLNVIRLNGVPITVITPRPVRSRLSLMTNVRTVNLTTNNVKRTALVPAVKPDMSTRVLRGVCMPLQTDVLMTNHSVNAVPLRLQPDARPAMP